MTIRAIWMGAVSAILIFAGSAAQAYDASFDYNADGVVNEADLDLIKAAFNTGEGDSAFDPVFDHDGDGIITGADVSAAHAAVAAN